VTIKPPEEGTLQKLSTFVAAFGIGVATYITIADSRGGAPVCLSGGSGCEMVANSSYSHLLGVNVAVLGIVCYALLLIVAMVRGDAARLLGFGLAVGGFGFSVYLTYLELFKIDAICEWCVISAGLMTLLACLNTLRMVSYVGTAP
jgi:uncharacterized membrane protein